MTTHAKRCIIIDGSRTFHVARDERFASHLVRQRLRFSPHTRNTPRWLHTFAVKRPAHHDARRQRKTSYEHWGNTAQISIPDYTTNRLGITTLRQIPKSVGGKRLAHWKLKQRISKLFTQSNVRKAIQSNLFTTAHQHNYSKIMRYLKSELRWSEWIKLCRTIPKWGTKNDYHTSKHTARLLNLIKCIVKLTSHN